MVIAAPLASACLLSLVLLAACSVGDDKASVEPGKASTGATIVADGERVEVARLIEAVSGLCEAREQASKTPAAAKTTYGRRSKNGVEATIKALRSSHAGLATAVTEAFDRVEADLLTQPPAPTLADDLGQLGERMRRGLAALGITTKNCP